MSSPDEPLLSDEELFEMGVWRCSDGSTILLGDMKDEQLDHAIASIETQVDWRRYWLPDLLTERERREELDEYAENSSERTTAAMVTSVNATAANTVTVTTTVNEARSLLLIAAKLSPSLSIADRLDISSGIREVRIELKGGASQRELHELAEMHRTVGTVRLLKAIYLGRANHPSYRLATSLDDDTLDAWTRWNPILVKSRKGGV